MNWIRLILWKWMSALKSGSIKSALHYAWFRVLHLEVSPALTVKFWCFSAFVLPVVTSSAGQAVPAVSPAQTSCLHRWNWWEPIKQLAQGPAGGLEPSWLPINCISPTHLTGVEYSFKTELKRTNCDCSQRKDAYSKMAPFLPSYFA